MYEKYKKELSLAKNKLLAIDFFLEKDSDYIATFGNGTTWKIDFNGKWYDNYNYISIRNESSCDNILGQKGVPIWMLMKIFGLSPDPSFLGSTAGRVVRPSKLAAQTKNGTKLK